MVDSQPPISDDSRPDEHGRDKRSETQDVLTYPEPPTSLKGRGVKRALLFFGPGAIVASASLGMGETLFAARGGALFGYGILWIIVVAAVLKFPIAYASSRYAVLTGEHPVARMGHSLPGPRGWFPISLGVLTTLTIPVVLAGLSLALGNFATQLVGGDDLLWATGFVIIAGSLACVGGYGALERIQMVILALLLIAVVVAVFWSMPNWSAVLRGFVPQPISYPGWLAGSYPELAARPLWIELVAYVGVLGGSLPTYIAYIGFIKEKRWGLLSPSATGSDGNLYGYISRDQVFPLPTDEQEIAKARIWLRAPRMDAALSFSMMGLAGLAFAIGGANLLHSRQLVPSGDDLWRYQARFLQVINPTLEYLYYVSIFFVLFGTVHALWEMTNRVAIETLGSSLNATRHWNAGRWRRLIFPWIFVVTLLSVWSGLDAVTLVAFYGIVTGGLGLGAYMLALLYVERRTLPPNYRFRPIVRQLYRVVGFILLMMGAVALLQVLGVLPG